MHAAGGHARRQPGPASPALPQQQAKRPRGRPRKAGGKPALKHAPAQHGPGRAPLSSSNGPNGGRQSLARRVPGPPRGYLEVAEYDSMWFDSDLLEHALEFQVYRRQTVHEPQVQSWMSTHELPDSCQQVPAEVPGAAPTAEESPAMLERLRNRPRVKISTAARRVMRAERRRRRREEGFAAVAAARGVETEAVLLAAKKRGAQRRRIQQAVVPDGASRISSLPSKNAAPASNPAAAQQASQASSPNPAAVMRSFYLKPRRKLLTKDEELELVQTWQAWKAVERRGREWASEASGREVTAEALAELVGCRASDVHLLQRDASVAHQEIQSSFIALVHKLARGFEGSGMSHEDLVIAGLHGLDTGLLKFDASRGNRLCTVVVWWIRNALYKTNSNEARAVRLPTSTIEQMQKVSRAIGKLGSSNVDALVEATGVKRPAVKRIVNLVLKQSECSLDSPVRVGGSTGGVAASSDTMSLHELLGTMSASGGTDIDIDSEAQYGFMDSMAQALAMLPQREAYVLRRLFGLDNGARAKLVDLARELSVAPSRVSQIRNNALQRLRYDKRFRHLEEYEPMVRGGLE